MEDAIWIQQLHSCGLLKRSFLPDNLTESLRTLVRQRKALLHDRNRCIQRIQKNFELMNLKIHTVISDIMGETGKKIIEAIINGQREAKNFLPLIDKRIQASDENIVKSLEGNWRPECLFLVKQCYVQYQQLQQHICDCEQEVENILQQMIAIKNDGIIEPVESQPVEQKTAVTPKAGNIKKKKKNKNTPKYDVRQYLLKIHEVDVLDIFGISEISALEILSETGRKKSFTPSLFGENAVGNCNNSQPLFTITFTDADVSQPFESLAATVYKPDVFADATFNPVQPLQFASGPVLS
jgi:hypothetical protein